MNLDNIKTDCRYFRGDIPCKPHKNFNVHCISGNSEICKYYEKTREKILIIKLGAIGDVIRTTPLLSRIKKEFPQGKIYWLTLTPSVLPHEVDVALKFTLENILFLQSFDFDVAINLDKDKEACSLLNSISAKEKKGYCLKEGIPFPVNDDAVAKYMTGLFDDLNKSNTKSYPEEIFEICGYKFEGEKYILSPHDEYSESWSFNAGGKIIGLNTGCGGRWTSRLWAEENWVVLAKNLNNKGYEVVFLGGEQEHEKNSRLAELTGGKYFGYFNLEKFINLVNHCNLVVTGVTMAMHITIALGKKIVLFNNIFNPNEFDLYGLGEIIEPSKECVCYFTATCKNNEYKCMEHLEPERVLETVTRLLPL